MPATFQAAQAELIDLRSALAILQAGGHEYAARVLTDAIEKLEGQMGWLQVVA
jgi:hypothetical protein